MTPRRTTFDTLSEDGRSALMSKIRSKNTKPELILRRALFRDGLRYRLHRRDLPGTPDICIEKYKLIVDVRGCFWHGHEECRDGHTPRKNTKFWEAKLKRNVERDQENTTKLKALGYSVFVVWACGLTSQKAVSGELHPIYDYLNSAYGLGVFAIWNRDSRMS